MDGQQHHQEIIMSNNNNNNNQSLESMLGSCTSKPEQEQVEKKPRPQPEQALKCPRCDSTNTKFCYYNNYSLSQPRYFCKSCRRYWTKGGTLRNVPVGGGCRKNKRSSSSASSKNNRAQDQLPFSPLINSLPPLSSYDSEFTLALARLQKQTCGVQLGLDDHEHHHDLSSMLVVNNGFNNMQNDLYMGEVYNSNNDMMLPYDHNQQEMMSSVETTQAVTVTTIKQELCNVGNGGGGGREQSDNYCNSNNNNNKVLWGFPWQINGDTNIMLGGDIDLSSSRASWNTPSWHGLLNTPLM